MQPVKYIACAAFFIFLSAYGTADPGKSDRDLLSTSHLIAQNTINNEADSAESEEELPPPPEPKISSPINKPVKQTPEEKKPEKEEKEQTQAKVIQKEVTTAKVSGPNIPAPVKPAVPSVPTVQTKASSPAAADTAAVESNTPSPQQAPVKEVIGEPEKPTKLMEELSLFNVSTANLRTMKTIIDDKWNLRGMVYGDGQGYIRILKADNEGNFTESWKSPPLNSAVRGLFVNDLDVSGETEIVAYTADGNIYIYGYDSHTLIYKTPEGTYQKINCMVIANMDSDPQMELFFIGVRPGTSPSQDGKLPGNLIQFDTKTQFEEWTSTDLYSATEMLIGNVDTDPESEIILNTNEILNIRFKDVEWISTIDFGNRLYLIDLDDDGILELVTEYNESFIKIIDVDQRQEKW